MYPMFTYVLEHIAHVNTTLFICSGSTPTWSLPWIPQRGSICLMSRMTKKSRLAEVVGFFLYCVLCTYIKKECILASTDTIYIYKLRWSVCTVCLYVCLCVGAGPD